MTPVPPTVQMTFRTPVAASPQFTLTESVSHTSLSSLLTLIDPGPFYRTRWCRKHSLAVSRCSQGHSLDRRRCNRGRVPGQARSRTRRGNHRRKPFPTLHNHTTLSTPSSIRNSTPRAVVVPETFPALVPAPEVRRL